MDLLSGGVCWLWYSQRRVAGWAVGQTGAGGHEAAGARGTGRPTPPGAHRRRWGHWLRGCARRGITGIAGRLGRARRLRRRHDLPLDSADSRWAPLPRTVRLQAGPRGPARARDAAPDRFAPGVAAA